MRSSVLFHLACLLLSLGACTSGLDPGGALPMPDSAQGLAAPQPRDPPPALPDAPLAVLDRLPEGEAEVDATIRVRFTRPAVALAALSEQDAQGLLELSPPVAGRASWATPDLLIFEPSERLQEATTYTVTTTDKLAALTQAELGPRAWSFSTPPPKVARSWPEDGHRDLTPDTEIWVELNHPFSLSALKPRAAAIAKPLAPGRADEPPLDIPLALSRPTAKDLERAPWGIPRDPKRLDHLAVIKPAQPWPLHAEVTFVIGAGLVADLGPRPTQAPWTLRFQTYGPLQALDPSCTPAKPCQAGYHHLEIPFNRFIKPTATAHVRVSPAPKNLKAKVGGVGSDQDHRLILEATWLPDTDYQITLGAAIQDHFGQKLGRDEVRAARFHRPLASMDLHATRGTLSGAPVVGFVTHELTRVQTQLVALTPALLRAAWDAGQDPSDPDGLDLSALAGAQPKRLDHKLDPKGEGRWDALSLNLAQATGLKHGAAWLEHTPAEVVDAREFDLPPPQRAVIQWSELGVWVGISARASFVHVARPGAGGEPVAGARVTLWRRGAQPEPLGQTDAQGLLALPAASDWPQLVGQGALWVEDDARQDRLFVPLAWADQEYRWEDTGLEDLRPPAELRGELIPERGVYRPGEPVYLVGWLAQDAQRGDGDLDLPSPSAKLALRVEDSRGQAILEQTLSPSPHGKVEAKVTIPPDAPLGRYSALLLDPSDKLAGGVSASWKVEDYRVPEFSVQATAASPEVLEGTPNKTTVLAEFYFGGPVPIQDLRHSLTCHGTRLTPAKLDAGWEVGVEGGWSRHRGVFSTARPQDQATVGRAELALAPGPSEPRETLRCKLAVAVQDASLQEVGGEASWIVHPAPLYLAVQGPQGRLIEGQRAQATLKAVSWAGDPLPRPAVKVTLERRWWEPQYAIKGKRRTIQDWTERTESRPGCALPANPDPAATTPCNLNNLKEGSYTLRASALIDGHEARTELGFYVAPKRWGLGWGEPSEELTVSLGRGEPTAGDEVVVTVQAPATIQQGVLLLKRAGLRRTLPFRLAGGVAQVPLRLEETWAPNIYIEAVAWERLAGQAPVLRFAQAELDLAPSDRRLLVSLTAPAQAGPNDKVPVEVHVTDLQKRPVQGRVALWATDEAVLSLTRYSLPDLIGAFLIHREPLARLLKTDHTLLTPFIAPSDDPYLSGLYGIGGVGYGSGGAGVGMGSAGMGGAGAPPAARARFETTPLFLGDVPLDAQGRAVAELPLPENLTTFRLIAVASSSLEGRPNEPGRFGDAHRFVRVTAPLVLRAALPRHLRPGDEADLAAIVQNAEGPRGTLRLSAKLDGGLLSLLGPAEQSATIEPGGQARVLFRAKALGAGTPTLTLSAVLTPDDPKLPTRQDAVAIPIPVAVEPTLVEHVALYGDLSDATPASIPVQVPREVLPGFGGLELDLSPTLLRGLQDATDALIQYPYGCAEQTSSRLLPLVALKDLRGTLDLKLGDVDAFGQAGVERLLSMQTPSGGFAYWPGHEEPHPYVSGYVTWLLGLAQRAGFTVPPKALERAYAYLETITRSPDRDWPAYILQQHDIRRAISVHALAEAGRPVRTAVDELWERHLDLPLFARAFLLLAMHRADPQDARLKPLGGELLNALQELPATAHATERNVRWDLSEVFHSDARTDALVLLALLKLHPKHPLVGKLARGLMEARLGGAWRNTQENAYGLLGLAEFARAWEAEPPAFTLKTWIGEAAPLVARFDGRQAPDQRHRLSMAELLAQTPAQDARALPVILQREGQGRAYYRLALSYAPAAPQLPAQARGLEVTRQLRGKDGPLPADAALVPGQLYALDLTVKARARVRYVAVDVPLPPGLEAINLRLGGPKVLPMSGHTASLSHEELRKDRALLFADDLQPGELTHTIYLRATTPGAYTFPPARAEAMYTPEVFGRSEGGQVVVR